MSCCYPLKAFKTGYLTDKGKDDFLIVSSPVDMMDVSMSKKPIDLSKVSYHLRNGHIYLDDPVYIPCGKCVGCRMADAKQWKIRCVLELSYHEYCYFITLTYDDDHLPFNEYGEPVLVKDDLQRFFKRFRYYGYDVSYFSCGEYGDRKGRPHYHALVYLDKDLQGFSLVKHHLYFSETLQKIWTDGNSYVEEVCPGNISYVCGYVEKKQLSEVLDEHPVKPFRLMSRRPGIGMSYLKDHLRSIESTRRVYGVFSDRVSDTVAPIPKSLLRKFEDTDWFKEVKEENRLAGIAFSDVTKAVYKTVSQSKIGDEKSRRLYAVLSKKRSETL